MSPPQKKKEEEEEREKRQCSYNRSVRDGLWTTEGGY